MDTSSVGGSPGGQVLIHTFVISYIIIVSYVLLNIVLAALLESFSESRLGKFSCFRGAKCMRHHFEIAG